MIVSLGWLGEEEFIVERSSVEFLQAGLTFAPGYAMPCVVVTVFVLEHHSIDVEQGVIHAGSTNSSISRRGGHYLGNDHANALGGSRSARRVVLPLKPGPFSRRGPSISQVEAVRAQLAQR